MTQTPDKTAISRRNAMRMGTFGAAAAAAAAMGHAQSARADASNPPKDLAGKTAFITGGARGIGLASAEELARVGADIVLFDVASGALPHVHYPLATRSDLDDARTRIEACGASPSKATSATWRASAPPWPRAPPRSEASRSCSPTPPSAMWAPSKRSAAAKSRPNSRSMWAATSRPRRPPCPSCASAAGAGSSTSRRGSAAWATTSSPSTRPRNGLSSVSLKSAALSYGRDNIMCNVVAPGLVRTPFADNDYVLSRMMPHVDDPTFDAVSEMLEPHNPIPVGHLEVEDIAKSVLFFASDATARMTGEVLDASYGSAARNIG